MAEGSKPGLLPSALPGGPSRLATLASLIWLVIVLVDWLGFGTERAILSLLLTASLPVALFWLIARLARTAPAPATLPATEDASSRQIEALGQRLAQQDARLADLARQTKLMSDTLAQLPAQLGSDRSHLAEYLSASLRKTLEAMAAQPDAAPESPDQARLPLTTPSREPSIGPTTTDLIRAANFPDGETDHETVAAIRQALKNRNMAQLLQAAEDILNLLAQDGIYMDDLHPAHSSAQHWRAFAAGRRGPDVASVGAIHHEPVLDRTRARARADHVFRDTSLYFQRRFDAVLGDIARVGSDAEILALANTRTGRAFMLLARVSGTFD